MAYSQFNTQDLDYEIARRKYCPPYSLKAFPDQYRGEHVSLNRLKTELDHTPADDPERTWREWEYAIAERQISRGLSRRFFRVVER